MYSIPPGGFRHPYPALAMNASMSRWVSAGMRDPPQWVFSCSPEGDVGLRVGSRCSWEDPQAQAGPRGVVVACLAEKAVDGPHGWARGVTSVGSPSPSCTSQSGMQRKTRLPIGLSLLEPL